MIKHYCADRRGKKWFIDSHPVHSNVKPSKEICFEHVWSTQNFLYSSYQKPACSDASIQEQMWLAQFVFPPHTITVHLWTSSSEAYDNKNIPMEQKDKNSSSSLSLFLTYLWKKLSRMYCLIRICNMQPDLLHHLFWLGFEALFWIQVQGLLWIQVQGLLVRTYESMSSILPCEVFVLSLLMWCLFEHAFCKHFYSCCFQAWTRIHTSKDRRVLPKNWSRFVSSGAFLGNGLRTIEDTECTNISIPSGMK
jgi:hypothetical protein